MAAKGSGVDQRLHTLAAGLRDEQRTINARLDALDEEAKELRAARLRIERVLRSLDPASFVAKPKKPNIGPTHVGGDETNETKRRNVVEFLNSHRGNYSDGIIAAVVYRDMKTAKITPVASPGKVREVIMELHSNGVLRADRKVRGGAIAYMFNGGPDGEA